MSVSEHMIEPWLREILRCPRCKGQLTDATGDDGVELQCSSCRLGYPLDSGIPVLLVDLARPLG
ncbi:MAG: hypothetical protein L0H79_15745 [Intrasporangium sp.]|uniref:Trm112 family protein n=1 Tax=Intrasporangium sp. TaxID=1925024 RepID=UPI00264A1601|nr:Trm112 family protein [Intrasporangium sp.]MDN5797189.1 hypothetical protein [Intrasporangium sp.]